MDVSERNYWHMFGDKNGGQRYNETSAAGLYFDEVENFLENDFIGLAWANIGRCENDRLDKIEGNNDEFFEAIKKRLKKAYPDDDEKRISQEAGNFRRFVREMNEGDLVFLSKKERTGYHIGIVDGRYYYDDEGEDEYEYDEEGRVFAAHRRKVNWIDEVSKKDLGGGKPGYQSITSFDHNEKKRKAVEAFLERRHSNLL